MPGQLQAYIEARSIPIPFAGCWLWLLSFGSHGYGNASTARSRVALAHRVSYEAFKGPIPSGMLIQHSCDNKWCVNPEHLSVGTDSTNALDKQRKGRAAKKLSATDAIKIRSAIADGTPIRRVARRFDVNQRMIQRIGDGGAWSHV